MLAYGKLVTLIPGSIKQHSLFFTGDDDEVFLTRSLNIMPKTNERYLIVWNGKSEG